ncbi:MAG: hypothetical protein V3V16_02395 [Melioribacteraceae bacterium]
MKDYDEVVNYYFFFPYFKCSEKLDFGGIDLYPSNNLDGLEPNAKSQINFISNKFYMSADYKIKNMTVGHIKEKYNLGTHGYISSEHSQFSKLLNIRELLIYFYSSLHPTLLTPFLDINASNLYTFRVNDKLVKNYKSNENLLCLNQSENDILMTDGFSGLLNELTFISIDKDENIFPPFPSFDQNYTQNLFADINRIPEQSLFNFINDESKLEVLFKTSRLIRSMKWYNRSINNNISDHEQLIYLSVSFESLLDLGKEKNITNRFKNSINILLGNNSKLNAWITQFYNARSEIVHRGYANDLNFSADQKNKEKTHYRDLLSYGRRIFQILFNSIIVSEYFKNSTNLVDLFISNRERVDLLIKKINKNDTKSVLEQNESLIDKLIEYQYAGSERILIKDLIHLVVKIADCYKKEFEAYDQLKIDDFINEKDMENKLLKYFELHRVLQNNKGIPILTKLNSICWHYLMNTVFAVVHKRKTTI